jgi:hypothetical protein
VTPCDRHHLCSLAEFILGTEKQEKKLDMFSSVIVNYITTTGGIHEAAIATEYAPAHDPDPREKEVNFLRRMNMKSLRFALPVVLMSLSAAVFAQSAAPTDAHKSLVAPAPSEAQKSFATIKSLAGEWEGPVAVPEMPQMSNGKPLHVSLRVTSRGNALVHELQEAGTPLDATKYDHPVTMLYVDGDQLTLIHYCDAGNRPRMTGKMSPDGKTVEFEFKDISGDPEYHMHHSVFTIIDANHHTEDWTFMMKDKPIHAHFDLHRTN